MSYSKGLYNLGVDQLILDPLNPRLPERLYNANESDVLNWMLTDATLADLIASIAENGFFGGEALVGVNSEEYPDKVIIVEGNRRLASVKILKDPEIANTKINTVKLLANEAYVSSNIPNQLPVYIVENRQEIANYLGFRHVSGVKQWPVIAKARYLYSLFSSRYWTPDIYRQLAKEIGSKSLYVRRLIVGYGLFLRIRQNNFFDLDHLNEENFDLSLINDAATKYSEVMSFMGIKLDLQDPLQELVMSNFREVFNWLYQRNDNGETKLGESRNLPILNRVLSNDNAKNAFLSGKYTLSEAAGLTSLADDNVRWHLQNARISMIEAQKLVHTIQSPNKSDYRLVDEIRSSADTIKREMADKMFNDESSI